MTTNLSRKIWIGKKARKWMLKISDLTINAPLAKPNVVFHETGLECTVLYSRYNVNILVLALLPFLSVQRGRSSGGLWAAARESGPGTPAGWGTPEGPPTHQGVKEKVSHNSVYSF
jgi:hypothetical protein